MSQLHLTPDDEAALRKAMGVTRTTGLVKIEVCPLCISPKSRRLFGDQPDGIEVVLADGYCQDCESYRMRHPETFQWVARVVAGQAIMARWRRES
jgi:hypothetical protein